MRKPSPRSLCAAGAVVAVLAAGAAVVGFQKASTPVTLSVDGASHTVHTDDHTVGAVLDAQHIALGSRDQVTPSVATPVSDDLQINVSYAKPVTYSVDGRSAQTRWSTADTVGQFLGQFHLTAAPGTLSVSPSTVIARSGTRFSLATAKPITLVVAGQTHTMTTAATTVAGALASSHTSVTATDVVSPALSTQISAGGTITVTKVLDVRRSKTIELPYQKTQTQDSSMQAGTTKVTTAGRPGSATETYAIEIRNGKVTSQVRVGLDVVAAPQNQVTAIGTKPQPSSSGNSTRSGSDSGSSSSSDTGGNSSSQDLSPAQGESCTASYYDTGQMTASGAYFDPMGMTAANKELPLGTWIKVTNDANGKTVKVLVNDRGPYVSGRCLDLSKGAFEKIGDIGAGTMHVTFEVIGKGGN